MAVSQQFLISTYPIFLLGFLHGVITNKDNMFWEVRFNVFAYFSFLTCILAWCLTTGGRSNLDDILNTALQIFYYITGFISFYITNKKLTLDEITAFKGDQDFLKNFILKNGKKTRASLSMSFIIFLSFWVMSVMLVLTLTLFIDQSAAIYIVSIIIVTIIGVVLISVPFFCFLL